MKKGISVLLVAAALFGFYGGAVNLNDILNCKDYWEEAGEKSTADMNKLEDGLNQLKDNEQAYLDGLDQVAEGEQALADGEAELAKGEADYAAAPGKLAAGEKKLAAGKAAYSAGQKELAAGQSTLNKAKSMLKQLQDGAKELSDPQKGYPAWRAGITMIENSEELNAAAEPFRTNGSIDESKVDAQLATLAATQQALVAPRTAYDGLTTISDAVGNTLAADGDDPTTAATKQGTFNALKGKVQGIAQQLEATDKLPEGFASLTNNQVGVGTVKATCSGLQKGIDEKIAAQAKAQGVEGVTTLAGMETFVNSSIASLSNLKALAAGKKTIQNKLLPLLDSVKDNQEFVQKLGGKTAVQMLLAGLNGTDAQFKVAMDQVMAKVPGLIDTLKQAIAKGEKDLAAGKKKLAAGAKELKAGEKTLAQGYADYKAAPGKLEDGRQQLADGRAQLAAGKDKLAQYEDGEQQVRDGLATLVGTEADLELESILDRLNGDGDFDNGDNHLELDEGLAAVDVGRGYQAEDGELITKEIMTRAIGTGGLLAAGVLAVLAAILSFMKKNKGAGVLAILSAVAGAFGAYEATQAGTYFSSIAGSTVGQTGMIAAGILAAVALVHSIAHFTAKKEA